MRLRWRAREARRDALWRAVHWGWREFQQAGLVTADTPAGRAFRRFGPGSLMAFPPGSVFGEGGIEIGDGTLIGQLVTMSAGMVPGQDLGGLAVLTIGDRCVIGRGSHIVAHQSVEIGDDVWTGPYVYITDQNHGYEDPGVPIGNQFPVNRPVSIGAGSWLGAGAIILPGARIGRNVVVAAGSVVRGNVQDWCVVAGVPAKVIREHTQVGWQPARATGQKPAPRPGQKPAPRPDRAPGPKEPGPKEPGPKEPGQERGQKPGQAVGQP
jgi:acetyltransferase-like isoleucine patch superfamily enzyme